MNKKTLKKIADKVKKEIDKEEILNVEILRPIFGNRNDYTVIISFRNNYRLYFDYEGIYNKFLKQAILRSLKEFFMHENEVVKNGQ